MSLYIPLMPSISERRALVVEDDPDIRALVCELLSHSGFTVHEVQDGAGALAALAEAEPDLITLDLNLPDLDGIEVCRQIRDSSNAYIIMITARPDEIDRLIGLETGADDYLTKPFSPRELRARVAALMRRPRQYGPLETPAPPEPEHEQFRHGDLEVDVEARLAVLGEEELELTRTEFDLLVTLLRAPRRVFERDTLFRTVWGESWVGDGHLVEVHMGNLRRKLGDPSRDGRYIRTVRGVGYRLGPG